MFVLVILVIFFIIYILILLAFSDKTKFIKLDFNEIQPNSPFPSGFLWGAATSSYQVEGNITNNNWWEFELREKNRIRNTMHKYPDACKHIEKFEEDVKLMKEIGLNSYRFSLEWSKIQPEEKFFDDNAIRQYSDIIDLLIQNDIKPMITLHHFTNPLWFEKQGAFLNEKSTQLFLNYVKFVTEVLKDKVDLWCTINEPSIYAVNGYFTGFYPPGIRDANLTGKVLGNLLNTHAETYKLIKNISPSAQVGFVINYIIFEAPNPLNPFDVVAAKYFNQSINDSQLEFIKTGRFKFFFPFIVQHKLITNQKETFDFIGLNYYTRSFLKFRFNRKKMLEVLISESRNGHSDLNWEIYPEGLYRALLKIRKFTGKHIYITENGIADSSDSKRSDFIKDHLLVTKKALEDGFDIRGYFHWSLLDNYEWGHGFDAKFGLIKVDFETQKRNLKSSAYTYSDLIKSNS